MEVSAARESSLNLSADDGVVGQQELERIVKYTGAEFRRMSDSLLIDALSEVMLP